MNRILMDQNLYDDFVGAGFKPALYVRLEIKKFPNL